MLSAYNSIKKLGDWEIDTNFWRELTKAEVRTLTAILQDKNGRTIASDTIRTIHSEGDFAIQNLPSHYIKLDIKSDFKIANFVFKDIDVSKMDGNFKIFIKSN